MKICHVTSVHPRYDIRIFEKECVSLAKNGYETFLVVNDEQPDELIKGVSIVSTGFSPKNRGERFLKSSSKVFKKAVEIDAEIYHLHDPELLSIVCKLKKLGKKVIFDAHEDTELQVYDKSWIPTIFRNSVAKGYSMYFRKTVKKLDGIISVTPAFVKKFRNYNPNCILVTNYPSLSEDSVSDVTDNSSEGVEYIFFAGNISRQWNHELVVKAADKCGVRYRFAGKGDDDYISEICAVPCAEYLGTISHDQVFGYYSKALAGVALLTCSQVGDEGTLGNTKLFEIMQAGIPVICTGFRLWKEIIDTYKCGLSVNQNNPNEIVAAIKRLQGNSQLAKELGRNGKKAVNEVFNWKTQEKELVKFYQELSLDNIVEGDCNNGKEDY